MTELTTNTDYPAAQQGGMLPAIRSSLNRPIAFIVNLRFNGRCPVLPRP
jgi:hypothetical protein